ncbi:MAG TPA: type III pantothenate kinase [Candidatus Omnitrophota bacterium]|nr:type III pantothenate kinase [Candidatus Omnitrophota bacterium]
MILAIDIGNTTVSLAVLSGQRIVSKHIIWTKDAAKAGGLLRSLKRKFPRVRGVVICSVVPHALRVVASRATRVFKRAPLVIGRDITVPLKNNYKNPKQVGQDRLVGAYAAKMLYGYPAIIIDFGTAITFDVVNAQGAYDGGIIVPGIRLSAESLFRKTAMLPEVLTFKVPRSIVGKTTQDSILSGIFYGYAALCNGLIGSLQKNLKKKAKVIITGGHTQIMKKFIRKNITGVDDHLVFKGIFLTCRAARK